MASQIVEALALLEVENDEHWTADGLPRVDVVTGLLGEEVSRKQITEAALEFSRENTTLPGIGEGVTVTEPDPPKEPENVDTPGSEEPKVEEVESETPVEPEEEIDEETAEALEEIDKKNARIDEIDAWIKSLEVEKKELRDEIYNLRDSLGLVLTPSSPRENQVNIQKAIAASRATRQERAARVKKVMAALAPGDLDPRSPLDAAMGHKRGRHTRRPQRAMLRSD